MPLSFRLLLPFLFVACSGPSRAPLTVQSTATSPTNASPTAPRASSGTAGCAGGVALQVLGSGGPIAGGGRASSGYVLWRGRHAEAMVDLGPGTMLRAGEAGVDPNGIQALLISHMHVDHSADLGGFLKTTSFGGRSTVLPLIGPTGSDRFPSMNEFVGALVGPEGMFSYLGGFLDEGQPYSLRITEIDSAAVDPSTVFESASLHLSALGVPHGPVPALAFRAEIDGFSIGWMGDQRADTEAYIEFIRDVDLLVVHMAIPERPRGIAARLHALPSQLGRSAAAANVGSVVVSHLMARSLENLDDNIAAMRDFYAGPITVAADGQCFDLARATE